MAQAELMVKKKERPSLWVDIEKLEKGGSIPPYRGCVTSLNSKDIVVFEKESVDEAYRRQNGELNVKLKISYYEAETMRKKSNGYITNLSKGNALEIDWHEINKEVKRIKFRAYSGKGKFVWGNWFEIE